MDMKNIKLIKYNECCGCSACSNVCPKKCIKMQCHGSDYAFHPVVGAQCNNCGLCLKVCPVMTKKLEKNSTYEKSNLPKIYAVKAENSVRKISSSGGAFYIIANLVLSKGGVVYGAAWKKDNIFSVEHKRISSADNLHEIMGSKYIQSEIGDSYASVKKDLKDGLIVLFSGVSCQIEGLKNYLLKEYENLITIDILCHGVPSPVLFNEYLSENFEKVESINFRDKELGWRCDKLSIKTKDNNSITAELENNFWEVAYHRSICIRHSCMNCLFAGIPRRSDITLGDFWGISKIKKEIDVDSLGVSLLMINTNKGISIADSIRKEFIQIEEFNDLNQILKLNSFGTKRIAKGNREIFFSKIEQLGFNKAVKTSLKFNEKDKDKLSTIQNKEIQENMVSKPDIDFSELHKCRIFSKRYLNFFKIKR